MTELDARDKHHNINNEVSPCINLHATLPITGPEAKRNRFEPRPRPLVDRMRFTHACEYRPDSIRDDTNLAADAGDPQRLYVYEDAEWKFGIACLAVTL